jgi:hypothetical protein
MPAKAGIQYSEALRVNRGVSGYWIVRFRGR